LAGPDVMFVAKLDANMGADAGFPGGSYYCLQILAWWLSVMRFFYCEQRVLRLGAAGARLVRRRPARWAKDGGHLS